MKDAKRNKKPGPETLKIGVYPDTLAQYKLASQKTGLPMYRIAEIAIKDFLSNKAEKIATASAS